MDFRFGPEVQSFRQEVRAFLRAELAADHVDGAADSSDLTGLTGAFERDLLTRAGHRGFLGISLPSSVGGQGKPASYQAAFNLEVAEADAPLIDTAITLTAQPLLAWGSERQLQQLFPSMIAGQLITCIAYSEPEAGSDLASLTTVAAPDASGFLLSGVKALVTGAHKAQWCFTVARTRTDVPARDGLSMFIVDMAAPGVSVHRRPTMNGWTLSEIRFERVRLGPESLLGQENDGWRQLTAAVATEGGGMFHVGFARRAFDNLVSYARAAECADDPVTRDRIATLWIELQAAERLARRTVWEEEQSQSTLVTSSMSKVFITELLQRIAVAAIDIAGMDAVLWRPLYGDGGAADDGPRGRFGWEYLERVHGTLGGGTNELKRNLIARSGLGLRADRRSAS